MRIAIITFHRAYNCGAMLQAWALKTVLERMGHYVEFPFGPYNEVGRVPWRSALSLRARNGSLFRRVRSFVYRLFQASVSKSYGVRAGRYYDEFREGNLPERETKVGDFAKFYDLVMLGSDQVLNPRISGWNSYFLCNDIVATIPKIAYAVSVGDIGMSEADGRMVLEALSNFSNVSVREPFHGYFVSLDPSLLLDPEDYDAIAKPINRRKFLYLYSCEAREWEIEAASEIAARLGVELLVTPTFGRYGRERDKRICDEISPAHMIGYIKAADYVLAGSFHGTALALLHGKPFLTFGYRPDYSGTRTGNLLGELGEDYRIVNSSMAIEEMVVRLVKPYEEYVKERLMRMRTQSLQWLADSIKKVS